MGVQKVAQKMYSKTESKTYIEKKEHLVLDLLPCLHDDALYKLLMHIKDIRKRTFKLKIK